MQSTPPTRRRRLGQFFTPPALAAEMVGWACQGRTTTFLDPAVGSGVFIEELASIRPSGLRRAVAFDVDAGMLDLARQRADGLPIEWRCEDFLTARIDERFDAIVANPPYVRHHDAKLPENLFYTFERLCGLRLSRLTNVYCLFMLRIASLVAEHGRAIVLTPAEYLNADFGIAIKRALLRNPAFRGLLVFDPAVSVFDGLLTTAALTAFEGSHSGDDIVIARALRPQRLSAYLSALDGARPSEIDATIESRAKLDPATKWATTSPFIAHGAGRRNPQSQIRNQPKIRNPQSFDKLTTASAIHHSLRPLSDFARCMRGIATGANAFFTLSEADARRWRLPARVLAPCVTKAMHAPGPGFSSRDFERLRAAGKRVYLLDVTPATAHLATAYLRHGESLGIHQRYLTRHRTPWYVAERRAPADLWVTVFGRRRLRFVRNQARVLSLTTFHSIYLHPAYRRFLPMLMAYFQSEEFLHVAVAEQRVYGDGLLKFEPRDVGRLLVPDLDVRCGM